MKTEELTKLKIEKLKDEKENLKYGWDKFLQSQLYILVIFITLLMGILSSNTSIINKLILIVCFIIIILISNYLFFKPGLEARYGGIIKKINEIESLYNQLIKK